MGFRFANRAGLLVLVLLGAAVVGPGHGPAAWADDDGTQLDERIATLIKQLGDDDYSVRRQAQEELAQALTADGKQAEAEAAVERALRLNPDQPVVHYTLGQALKRRGLTDRSDREFRQAISIKSAPLAVIRNACRELAESLHDRGLDEQAAEVKQGFLDLIDSSKDLTRQADQLPYYDDDQWRARTFYLQACAAGQKRDFVRQRKLLDAAIRTDPYDVEVLVALYHLPEQTLEQHEKTMELIARAVRNCRNKIDEDPDSWPSYNQLVWLVANTEGDFDEATTLGEKSIELIQAVIDVRLAQPDGANRFAGEVRILNESLGGNYDTLAHCHAAKGDFSAAVTTQTEAKRLLPYLKQISDKLDYFSEQAKLPPEKRQKSP